VTPAEDAHHWFQSDIFRKAYLGDLKSSFTSAFASGWLRQSLAEFITPETQLVDMGCGLNPLRDLPCKVLGLDRHPFPGAPQYVQGTLEASGLPDAYADALVYSLSSQGSPEDLRNYFCEARRIAKPGCRLWIVEPEASFNPGGLEDFQLGMDWLGWAPVEKIPLRPKDKPGLVCLTFRLGGVVSDEADPRLFGRQRIDFDRG
jgi:hypothetical protein